MKVVLFFSVNLLIYSAVFAQQKYWSLEDCIQYAQQNNVSVQQADVQARMSALQLEQSKAAKIPTLNFSTNSGGQFGRSIDPTSNTFINSQIGYQSYSIQTGATLFNWFKLQNTGKANEADHAANEAIIAKLKNDVSLNVIAAYMQLLLSIEQKKIAENKIRLTGEQRKLTQKSVDAGALPELNVAQLIAQLAADGSSLVDNIALIEQNKLQLKALLNLRASEPFDINTSDISALPATPLSALQPDYLYRIALQNQPQQLADSLKLKSAEYRAAVARSSMYPTLSAYGNVGTNYSTSFIDPKSGHRYNYLRQLDINLSQSVGLSLSIPILSGKQARTAYRTALQTIRLQKIQQSESNRQLEQAIYTAYNNAVSGRQKYEANTKAESYAQYAFELAGKRYNIGMLSTADYLTALNNLANAQTNKAIAWAESVFRVKVLEWYGK